MKNIELKLKSPNELPDRDCVNGVVIVRLKGNLEFMERKYGFFCASITKGKRVSFLDYDVVAWAYYSDDDIEAAFLSRDGGWLSFLHDNAFNK